MIGVQYLSSIINTEDLYSLYKHKVGADHFSNNELPMYEYICDHISKYSKLPATSTLESVGFKVMHTDEPIDYYYEVLTNRFTYLKLKGALEESSTVVTTDTDKVETILQGALDTVALNRLGQKISDFKTDSFDILKKEYLDVNSGKQVYLSLGYPYLDGGSGGEAQGVTGGDVVSLVGRPASGKSFIMLNMSLNMWRKRNTILFVSMEMTEKVVVSRLASLLTKIPFGSLYSMALSDQEKGALFKATTDLRDATRVNPYIIMDGNLASSVQDVFSIAKQFNCSAVYIDGAYLLQHHNSRLDRYTKVAENIEAIKRHATTLNVPVICSYQFNREAAKSGGKLESIAYSDAIGQISSLVLGLHQVEGDDNPNVLSKRKVDVLKGRNGEVGEFYIKWNFVSMDLSEVFVKKEESNNQIEYAEIYE